MVIVSIATLIGCGGFLATLWWWMSHRTLDRRPPADEPSPADAWLRAEDRLLAELLHGRIGRTEYRARVAGLARGAGD